MQYFLLSQVQKRRGTEFRVAKSVTLVLLGLIIFSDPSHGGDQEKARAATVEFEKLGGKILKDANNKTQTIFYFETRRNINLSDAEIEAIDFSVFRTAHQLYVYAPNITDRALTKFAKIGELREVDIIEAKITDKGLVAFLKKFPALYTIRIDRSPITDRALAELPGRTELRMLMLSNLRITDDGLKHLTELDIVFLDLAGNNITDKGIADITRMRKLIDLNLSGTKLTDKGIVHLVALPDLKRLEIRSTKVTDKGVESLQKILPNLKIIRE